MLESALAQCPTYGRRNYHRRYTRRIARLANRAGLGKLAARMGRCSETLGYDDRGVMVSREACRCRACSSCQGARSARWAHRLHDAMGVIAAEHPTWRFILLTVTVPSVPILHLRDTLAQLHKALDRMAKRAAFAPVGWIRNTEETLEYGYAHPHAHLLCAVPQSYFEGPLRKEKGERGRPRIVPGYMTQRQWQMLWGDCLGKKMPVEHDGRFGRSLSCFDVPDPDMSQEEWRAMWPDDDAPVIDVRAIAGNLSSAQVRKEVYEITKYGQKPADLVRMDPTDFRRLHFQLKGTRTISVCGDLAPYLQEIPDECDEPQVFPSVVIAARWNEREKRYFTDFGTYLDGQFGIDHVTGWYCEAQEQRDWLNRSKDPAMRHLVRHALKRNALLTEQYADGDRIRDGTTSEHGMRWMRESLARDRRFLRQLGKADRARAWMLDAIVEVANNRERGREPIGAHHTCSERVALSMLAPVAWECIDGKLRRVQE